MNDKAQNTHIPQNVEDIKIAKPTVKPDFATIFGLLFALGVIVAAIASGKSDANFLNVPSFLIVIMGTIFVTTASFSLSEMLGAGKVISKSIFHKQVPPSVMAKQLLDIASIARKKGLLSLSQLEKEAAKDKYLADAIRIVTDGYTGDDIEQLLYKDLDSLVERHRRSAGILKRGAEVAPAMGLIGTLVGLVQMLANLQNPESIGPAMAVALLTTFYGAILGTVILAPLAAKLERNSNEEATVKSIIIATMSSIARQQNPRRLEMFINSELAPDDRITYFK